MRRVGKSLILTAIWGLSFVSTVLALEPGDTLWTRTYGDGRSELGHSVRQTADSGYIIGGSILDGDDYDVYLVKTDANGDTLWTRMYGGADNSAGFCLELTSDGGYVVAGKVWGTQWPSWSDLLLLKTNADGDSVWARTYALSPGDYCDEAYSVQETIDGGYIIAGFTDVGWYVTYRDVWLLKTDPNGDTLWTRTYGGTDKDRAYSVQQTSDGGYIIAGETLSFGAGQENVWLLKTDANGDTLWTRTYGGELYDGARSVQQTTDGGYIVAGVTVDSAQGNGDVFLLKTHGNGDTLWTRHYPGDGPVALQEAWSVQQTTDGGYIIAGRWKTYQGPYTGWDVYVVKTDADGDTLWTRTYGDDGYEGGYCVRQTTDGGYIVSGGTNSFGAGLWDAWLLKIVSREMSGVSMRCQVRTPIFCRGKNFYFALTLYNSTGSNVSGNLNLVGYTGHGCVPGNELITLQRSRTFPTGTTTVNYFLATGGAVADRDYSIGISGTLNPGDHNVSCCMNTHCIQCEPWRMGDNTEWVWGEVKRPEIALPTVTELYQNYPNPFNAKTNISYSLAEAGDVTLKIYDISGRLVEILVNRRQEAALYTVSWDASELSSGVYFYKLSAGNYTCTKKMNLLK